MVEPLYRLFRAMRNYRNPLTLAMARALGSPILKIEDRKTGLVFTCRKGADRMLAETFHSLIYDLPFAPLRPGDVVLDIGANHGFYSCWAARQGAIVHAFEPDPTTYQLLLHNIAQNGLEGRIYPHQTAIAALSGDMQMYCTAELGGGMSTVIPAFAVKTGLEVVSQSKVEALSLVDAMKLCEVEKVRVCKMDCEGAEQSILAGLGPVELSAFDAIVLEYHPQAYNFELFTEMLLSWDGYHISKIVGRDSMENANLGIVREDLIRQWCKGNHTDIRGPQASAPKSASVNPFSFKHARQAVA